MATTNNETEIIEPKERFIIRQLKPKKKYQLKYLIENKNGQEFIFTFNAKRSNWLCGHIRTPHDSWGFGHYIDSVNDISWCDDLIKGAILHSFSLVPYLVKKYDEDEVEIKQLNIGDMIHSSPSSITFSMLRKLNLYYEQQKHTVEFVYSAYSYSFNKYTTAIHCTSCKKKRPIVINKGKKCTQCEQTRVSICSHCKEGLCSSCDYGINRAMSTRRRKKLQKKMDKMLPTQRQRKKYFEHNVKVGDPVMIDDHTGPDHKKQFIVKSIDKSDRDRVYVTMDNDEQFYYDVVTKIEN